MQCAACGAALVCAANASCWCMAYPPVLPPTAQAGCWCERCLSVALQRHLAQQFNNQQVYQQPPPEARAFVGHALIEGVDYTLQEGLYVFSRWFHLKRGQCCGHACKHCPYGYVNVR